MVNLVTIMHVPEIEIKTNDGKLLEGFVHSNKIPVFVKKFTFAKTN